jgi:signal transduction histidine kinase
MHKQDISIENGEKSEQLLNLLNVITRNGKRLKQLTDNILDVTKIESHALKLTEAPTDIRLLIEDTVRDQNIFLDDPTEAKTRIDILCRADGNELMDETWSSSSSSSSSSSGIGGHELVANSDHLGSNSTAGRFIVDVDKAKIAQVVTNLLSNAIMAIRSRHDNEEGRIIIFIKSPGKEMNKNEANEDSITRAQKEDKGDGDGLIVSVKDNGVGIAPGVFQDLFQKFVTSFDSGTGLGLYICKNIIEAHGGRIWASNNTDTEGSAAVPSGATFSFSLPISRLRI